MEKNNNLPVYKIKVGKIDIAVWEQLNNNNRKYYSISYEKSYKSQRDKKWKKTKNILLSDIPDLITGLEKVFEYGRVREQKSKI